ncbi:uncharacterized protein NPIL_138741 [Nephila pilipes]|uniref:Uncharacterized protein n=1 Tax=Nephila pilipes TaxID=299642 RepID=A0A8X6UFA0_NEPPI|nr:uncharacterized protein NPIL_138741 [Nephila pilipes]
MESLNWTIKNTLQFISVIQDVCDKKRLYIESLNLHEYNQNMKEWKQKICVKPTHKEPKLICNRKEQATVVSITEEVDELALVDVLLEKAKNIRMKNKDLPKEIKNSSIKSQSSAESSTKVSKSNKMESQLKKRLCNNLKDFNGDKNVIPRSKSALISSTLKTTVVPRSKSANMQRLPKDEDKVPKTNEIITKTNCRKSIVTLVNKKVEQRVSDKSSSAVLTNRDLNEFKKLCSNFNNCDKTFNGKLLNSEDSNKALNSDCSQVSNNQTCFPTIKKIQNELKQKFGLKSNFKLQTNVFWYPYLNPQNQNYLVNQKPFDSIDTFNRALKIVCKIQETMLWIDLLSMVGSALSSLQLLDENDWNVVRVYSYLESIYHENLQRVPVLDSN